MDKELQYPDINIQDVAYSQFASVQDYVTYNRMRYDIGAIKAKMLAKQKVIAMMEEELRQLNVEYEAMLNETT